MAAGQSPALETQADDSSLVELLKRAGTAIVSYTKQLTNIVAEERYVQKYHTIVDAGMVGSLYYEPVRVLESDFLLIWLPQSNSWIEFRDVYLVDGKPVRERRNRLEALFLKPSSDSVIRARDIMAESARYNIGGMERDFNTPTFALRVLNPSNLGRFRFRLNGEETIAGVNTCKIEFQEFQKPTLVRNVETGSDLFSTGNLWIEPKSGQIIQTFFCISSERSNMRTKITVLFKMDAKLGIWAPAEMTEIYDRPRSPGVGGIECVATYSNYRQFQVTTEAKW